MSYRGRVLRGSNRVDLALNWIQQLSYDLHFQVYIFLIPGFDQPFSAYRHDDIHKQLAMIVSNYPGIKLVDLLEDFRSQGLSAESIAYDGLHPNARGHDALAGMFFQHLSHALTKQK